MPTISFDYQPATGDVDFEPPEAGYAISLQGDAGTVSRFEIDCVMAGTARALIELMSSSAPTELKTEIRGEPDDLDRLRSQHYIWRVERRDGKAVRREDLQYALMIYTMERRREPVFSIPLSALKLLLASDKLLIDALTSALADAAPMQREVHIQDQESAVGLVDLGLIAPTEMQSQYVLMDIEVH